ncbi:MAG: peptidylprolyl isomerase, partial [Oscillospiraceae bacterium]|nr:peptidylprolyl isomerase [Oscillospiraceae bacterium]
YDKVGGAPSLDGGYTVFGQVYEGFDVIDAISACEVVANAKGEMSSPVKTITITSVKVTEYNE